MLFILYYFINLTLHIITLNLDIYYGCKALLYCDYENVEIKNGGLNSTCYLMAAAGRCRFSLCAKLSRRTCVFELTRGTRDQACASMIHRVVNRGIRNQHGNAPTQLVVWYYCCQVSALLPLFCFAFFENRLDQKLKN